MNLIVVGKVLQEVMQLCPRCGSSIRASQMAEHMRIELLDPKWREQKQAFQAKLGVTNLVANDTIVSQLSQLTETRTDIFGAEEREVGTGGVAVDSGPKVIWDGHAKTAASATNKMNRLAQQQADTLLAQQQAAKAQKRQKMDPTLHMIQIQLPSSETLSIPLPKSATISHLKDVIAKETSIAVSKQKLSIDGNVLKNTAMVDTIVKGCVVVLQMKR